MVGVTLHASLAVARIEFFHNILGVHGCRSGYRQWSFYTGSDSSGALNSAWLNTPEIRLWFSKEHVCHGMIVNLFSLYQILNYNDDVHDNDVCDDDSIYFMDVHIQN